jgi:4-hydroxy-tetrahydrodipicolinate synthase
LYAGTIAPLITPVDETGAVSEAGIERLIKYLRPAVTGLMPALSTGEGWLLTDAQWRSVVAHTVAHADNLPVLAGILLPDADAVLARALVAAEIGVDAVVVGPPFGQHHSQDSIYRHFQRLSGSLPVPLFVYNEAVLSGVPLELDTLLRVLALPGVVGVKESSGSVDFLRAVLAADTGVPVFAGWENLLLETPGVDGLIGPLATVEPWMCAAMLADPSPSRQAEIDAACERFGLFDDDWYRSLKRELRERGVIDDDRSVDERGMGHADPAGGS